MVYKTYLLVGLLALLCQTTVHAQRKMEYLNRGVVATPDSKGNIFVSWRLLATDSENVSFNVYRSVNGARAVKINARPITAVTSWLDEHDDNTQYYTYHV